MIDTIKIYCEINRELHDTIERLSIIKCAIDCNLNNFLYKITNDSLLGSYDSRLSVRVGGGAKYNLCSKDGGYFLEIEGSYHKFTLGYNSHNGYCDFLFLCERLIEIVEVSYDISLPDLSFWHLQRVDVAICYNLDNQKNVRSYINSLSRCNYPRRKVKFFNDESLYLSGTTTTLKIYNKFLEFRKHDLNKLKDTDFKILEYLQEIQGFVRFECEIKKKKLQNFYNTKNILICDVNYEDLKKIWSDEFMKLLKFIENDLEIVRGREAVLERLKSLYKTNIVNVLYNFYSSIQLNGITNVKSFTSSTTFYRNLKYLKEAKIDLSQTYKVEECSIFNFNPFEAKEVA